MTMVGIISIFYLSAIYRWESPNGDINYGDHPPANAKVEIIDVPQISTIESPYKKNTKPLKNHIPIIQITGEKKSPKRKIYPSNAFPILEILSPKNNAIIRANNGNITLTLDNHPPLSKQQQFVVYLNGKHVSTSQSKTIQLSSVDRGENHLFVVIHNQKGDILSSSPTVIFQVLRVANNNALP